MIRNNWTDLEIRAVDKEYAKEVAQNLCRQVKIPETVHVFDLASVSVSDFVASMKSYSGKPLVAKPTHASGVVLFLKDSPSLTQLTALCNTKEWNYFYSYRETQYKSLAPKVIVESELPDGQNDDYKFFCSRGKVLFCQIDLARFTNHARELVSVPDFNPLGIVYRYPRPRTPPNKPAHFDPMIGCAKELSVPFDFVRIDLYATNQGIFFGEFTFTLEASFGSLSDEKFGVEIMNRIKTRLEHKN